MEGRKSSVSYFASTESAPISELELLENRSSSLNETNWIYGRGNSSLYLNATDEQVTIDDDAILAHKPLSYTIVVGIILALVVIVCILGNLLVCVTIMSNRKLQSPTNYFILCLSVSDLSLGLVVLPFSTILTVLSKWPLGPVFCNIYISSDVMLCTVSILTLFVISLDRYYAVTYPMRYLQHITTRRVFWVCVSIWTFSFVMAFLPIHLGLNTATRQIQNYDTPNECVFQLNHTYVLLISIGTYFIPLFVMCGVYMKVYYIARKQVARINQMTNLSKHLMENGDEKENQRRVSDSKATFTLASVVTAFAICWIPYFVIFTIKPIFNLHVNEHIELFALWLGYVNSLLNPFLYAFHNTEFRYAFMLILCKRLAERMKDKYTEVTYL